jgi:chemotaxis signal transduction protein
VHDLVRALREQYPNNSAVAACVEALGLDAEQDRDEKEYPWILFSLLDTAYGMNSKYVLSIEILADVTPIVESPHYCPGFTRSRGDYIELIDMRALFGSGDYQSAKEGVEDAIYMMVVAEINEIKRGLIVDEIISVEHLTRFEDGVVGEKAGSLASQYLKQIARREKTDKPVLILNPENLIML